MFPVNTIIAWYVNIYRKYEDMIITTLLLPLGHISNKHLAMSSSSPPYTRNISLVLRKYLRIFLTAIQCSEPGSDWYLLVKLIACPPSCLVYSMAYIVEPMAEE